MTKQLPLALVLDQDFSFDNFVPGQNWELISQLMQWQAGKMVYLYGSAGAGKSHLLKSLEATYFDAQYFPTQLAQCLEAQRLDYELDSDNDLQSQATHTIAVDDVDQLNAEQQATLFDLINHVQRQKHSDHALMLVCSGSQAPLNLKLREDLRNRLGWGLVYHVHGLKDEDILLAVAQRAFEKDLKISPNATTWLLRHTERSIRSLYAWLDALDLYSMAQRRQITVPLIKTFIEENQKDHHDNDPTALDPPRLI